jgi:hypothetical protein
MKCTVLLVFSCVFTVFSLQKHELLVHSTWIYQNTHIPYILHEMHCLASVFMCFHCVFTAETCTFGTNHIYIEIHMYQCKTVHFMCSPWNALFCIGTCVFTLFSLQKHVFLVHFTCIPKYTCTIYITWNAQLC